MADCLAPYVLGASGEDDDRLEGRAWSGYGPSLARDEPSALRPREDDVTVDPHELGLAPCGAGAFIVKDRRVLHLVHQEAACVFVGDDAAPDARSRTPTSVQDLAGLVRREVRS